MVIAACSQSDAGVTTAVKSKLIADDTVKAYKMDVDTKDKIVTLRALLIPPRPRPERSSSPAIRRA
jgi:hypothetical protein